MTALNAAVTPLDPLRLETLLEEYDVGDLTRYSQAATGIENSNYFLNTAHHGREHQYVLTILEQPANAGAALVPLLDACIAAGLPVPRVIRTRSNAPMTRLDAKPALLCSRLGGWHAYNPTIRQIEALGRFIARFHRAARVTELPRYPRDEHWLETGINACHGRLPFASEAMMRDLQRSLRSALQRHDLQSLPRGPIHGDLFRDNVLFNEQGLTGVLDFHHAAEGYLVYDLAVAANDWCTDTQGVLDPERMLALLRAYHRLRPLRRQELWLLPVFALYAALAFWVSRSVVATGAGRTGARTRNPEEFQRIAEQHARHFFYLDERSLGNGG